ncbi:hypothetical protein GCM10010385_61310 [Streptomyces geysiriensis]|nr:hypothetical protein GCM10010385_61310 [Streptomyces geysiriensis]
MKGVTMAHRARPKGAGERWSVGMDVVAGVVVVAGVAIEGVVVVMEAVSARRPYSST